MAKRTCTNKTKKAVPLKPDGTPYCCRDCANHYDECSPALDGHMILCHCPHYTDGKFCVFMNQPACDKFKL